MPGVMDRHFFQNRDATSCCAGTSRAVNHSCDPNCFTTPCGLEIAVRDIEARDELTND